MSTTDRDDIVAPVLRTLQIIVGAQVAGLTFFLGIVLLLNLQKQGAPRPTSSFFLVFALAFAVVGIAMSVVVPRLIVAGHRRKLAQMTGEAPAKEVPGAADWIGIYQTQKIVAVALTEAPGFFAIIAYMLEGNPLALGLALVLIAAQALHFPTREKVDRWIDQQAGRIDQERQFGSP